MLAYRTFNIFIVLILIFYTLSYLLVMTTERVIKLSLYWCSVLCLNAFRIDLQIMIDTLSVASQQNKLKTKILRGESYFRQLLINKLLFIYLPRSLYQFLCLLHVLISNFPVAAPGI